MSKHLATATNHQVLLPAPPEGWEWRTRPLAGERPGRDVAYRLVAPDGWATREYSADPERAVAEARRRVLSQPRKAAPVVTLAVSDAVLAAAPAIVAGAGEVEAFRYDSLGAEERITVKQLAREINNELDEIELRGLRVGARLVEVRQHLPRGTWRAWLAAECPRISPDTAENLILKARLAARTPKLSALEGQFAPTAITRLARPSVPDAAIDEAIRRAEAGEYLTVAAAEEIIRAEKAVARHSAARSGQEASRLLAEAATGADEPPRPAEAATGADEPPRPTEAATGAVEAPRPAEAATGKAGSRLSAQPSLVEQALAALTVVETEVSAGRIAEARAALTRLELAVLGWPDAEQQAPVLEQITALRLQWGETFLSAAPVPPPANNAGLWRTPYGAPGSGRWHPIVPTVLVPGRRRSWFEPAPINRCPVSYETASQVRVEVEGRSTSLGTHHVWCVPTEEAWSEITAAHRRFSAALAGVAAHCRALGRYDRRLTEAGGVAQAPNPLTPLIIFHPDPDDTPSPSTSYADWTVQGAALHRMVRHSAKMLLYRDEQDSWDTSSAQHQFFLCPDEATWLAFEAAVAAAQAASEAFLAVLKHYGTYKDAVEDGRYTGGAPVEQARAATPTREAPGGAEAPVRAATASREAPGGATPLREAPGADGAPARADAETRATCKAHEAATLAAARRAYSEVVGSLSLEHLALIAASLWVRSDLAWHEVGREELERVVAEYWTVSLADGFSDDESIAQVARRVGLAPRVAPAEIPAVAQIREELRHARFGSGAGTSEYHLGRARELLRQVVNEDLILAEELEREIDEAARLALTEAEVGDRANIERTLSGVEKLIAHGQDLPPGCATELNRCEATMQRLAASFTEEDWEALMGRIRTARHCLLMGLSDEE